MPDEKNKVANPDTSNSDRQSATGPDQSAPPSNEPPKKTEATDDEKAALKEAEAAKATKDATDKKLAADKDKTPLDTEVWGSTGHEGADAALGLLQNAGVTPEEAKGLLFDAVTSGDLSKVDWNALEKKIGADKTRLVRIGAESFLKDTETRNNTIIKELAEVAGSKENWDKVAAWAKVNLDQDKLGEWRGMIDSGGAPARFAASEIISAYNKDSNNSTLDTTTTTFEEAGDNIPGSTGEAIDRGEYAKRMAKLYMRGRIPPPIELETLNAARARGRKKGV